MTDFKVGDRVEFGKFCGDDAEENGRGNGRVGTVSAEASGTSFVTVTLDDLGTGYLFYPEELKLLPPKSKPPLTRNEYNDLVNQYESQIDQLNQVLDEIQEVMPEEDYLTRLPIHSMDACVRIKKILDKRPEQP